jgi:two-component system response regulator HydG
MAEILVVDGQRGPRATLATLLRSQGHHVDEASGGALGCEMGGSRDYDVVVSAFRMPDGCGLDVLRAVKRAHPMTEVILTVAEGTVQDAVEAMRLGAFDYVQGQFANEQLALKVGKALENRRLHGLLKIFAQELREHYHFENIIGRSQAMRDIMYRVVKIAPTDASVLLTGESGTGKELVARAVHANSRRAHKPFVVVNCAAIDNALPDSELFGHTKGAFTGAVADRKGLFEEADGGTVFLDDIAETTLTFQAKLLRVLDEREIRRVGESLPTAIDIRVVAATHVDLAEAVEQQRFRRDLYYRLNVGRLHLPPLRARPEDIGPLCQHLLEKYNRRLGARARLETGSLDRIVAYDFPGNVRELANLIEQAVALNPDGVIGPDDLLGARAVAPSSRTSRSGHVRRRGRSLSRQVEGAERDAIVHALHTCSGDRQRTASLLGISVSTLWRRMKALDIVYEGPKRQFSGTRLRVTESVGALSSPRRSRQGGKGG